MSYRSITPFLLSETSREDFSHLASWRVKGTAALRIAFGCVWAIDASFKWQPAFTDNFASYLTKALDGQPPAIAAWISFWLHVVSVNPPIFAYLVATGETCIALALLFGALSNLTYVTGILLSFVIWSTAEGFGGPYGAGSTDIGVSIVYVLVFIGLFLSGAGLTFGVDRYLATKLGHWNFLASGPVKQQREGTTDHHPIPLGYPEMFAHYPVEQHSLEPISGGTATTGSRLTMIKGQRLSHL